MLQTGNSTRAIRISKVTGCLLAIAIVAGMLPQSGSSLNAQVRIGQPSARSNPLPRVEYYRNFPDFYQGEYVRALKNYQQLAKSGYKDVNGTFLDSVCYLTMMGECYYHLGDYAKAVDSYETAVKIYINRSRWEPRTQIPPTIAPNKTAVARAKVTWFTSNRTKAIGTFPRNYSFLFGRLDNERVLGTGGAIQNPEARPVDIAEAMRCCALALYRRKELKGATCKVDPLTSQFARSLNSQQMTATNVVGAWKGVVGGIALASNEEYTKAARLLNQSLRIGGTYDHPLTAVALCELGNIAFVAGKYSDATKLYLEASHSAAVFEQYDLIEHAMRQATRSYAMQSPGQIFEPLGNAITWAARERARFVQASLSIELAHSYAEVGNTTDALKMLSQARRPMARNDISKSTVGGRMWYVSSLAKYRQGKSGLADFNRFLKQFQAAGSKWTYQLALAESLIVSNRINGRAADQLYSRLLRDPTDVDWQAAPMETMTFLASPRLNQLERWFEIAIDQRKVDKAIDIAESIRRHRFYSRLPLGGRVMAFRGLLEAPEDDLNDEDKKLRKKILARFSTYQKLSASSEATRKLLAMLPLKPTDTADIKKQKELMQKLGATSAIQETILGSLALMRLPSRFSVPPRTDLKSAQSALKKKQVIVYCVGTQFNFHVFLIGKDTYGHIGPIKPAILRGGVSTLLKDIGSVDRSAAVPIELLTGEKWKETSQKMMDTILPKRNVLFWQQFDEAIIVPDDSAWYIPFEVLQVTGANETQNLGDLVTLRYMPTLGFAVAENKTPLAYDRTGVVLGRLSSKDSTEKTQEEFDRLKGAVPGAESLGTKLNGPSSLLSSVFDMLIVWAENKDTPGYRMSLMQFDKGKPGSTLGSWMALPWRGPQTVVMPGFSSGASNAGRSRVYGDDLYVTSCALLAAGAKTILISRWRVGGTTSLVVTREFASQLEKSGARDSWNRAVKIVSDTELDFEAESRIKITGSTEETIKGSHPFFWAGYLLIDAGKPVEQEKPDGAQDDEGQKPAAEKGDAKADKVDAKADKGDAKADKGGAKDDKGGAKDDKGGVKAAGADKADGKKAEGKKDNTNVEKGPGADADKKGVQKAAVEKGRQNDKKGS